MPWAGFPALSAQGARSTWRPLRQRCRPTVHAWRPGAEATVSHTWLDTFDWRLHSAGISLQFADGGPLVMQRPDGARLHAPLAGVKWPAQAHDLPAGPIRDALAPLIAPRALMPVVTVRSAALEARVLDAEEKTVARLLTESIDDGAGQLRIQPLRGYDADG